MILRRHLLLAAAGAALTSFGTRAVAASTPTPAWRERPLRVLLPFAPGGPSDIVLRAMAGPWQAQQHQPLVVEHRPGAGGTLGAAALREAAPDGATLLLAPSDVLVNATVLHERLPYDPLTDFTLLARIGPVPLVLAIPAALPVTDLAGFVRWARGRRIAYGSWGAGSHAHLLAHALLVRRLGLYAVHVPYRGLGPMLQDLGGGQITLGIGVAPVLAPLLTQGRLRALAISGDTRSAALPDLPTLPELGFDEPAFQLRQWAAFAAPAALPSVLAARLEADLAGALAAPEVERALRLAGFESGRALGAREAQAQLRADLAWVPALIRALGVQPQ